MLNKKRSKKAELKYKTRQRLAKVEPALEEQFQSGRLLGKNNCIFLYSFGVIFLHSMMINRSRDCVWPELF
jgi:hypothetical protein